MKIFILKIEWTSLILFLVFPIIQKAKLLSIAFYYLATKVFIRIFIFPKVVQSYTFEKYKNADSITYSSWASENMKIRCSNNKLYITFKS